MPQKIIALDITGPDPKASVLETSFRDYRVLGLYHLPAVAGDGTVEQRLRKFLESNGLTGQPVLSALSGDQVTWRVLFLPFRENKKLAQALPFEIESLVPFDLDAIVIDYQILHRDRSGTLVLAGLVPKKVLEQHLGLLESAGVDPKLVDLAPLSALNVLALVTDRPAAFAFIDLSGKLVTVALFRNGELVGFRSVSASSTSQNGSGKDVRADLICEIRWTLLAINGAPIDEGLPCYVAGEASDVAEIERTLASDLGLEVRRLADAPLKNIPSELRTEVPVFSSALGLALREAAPADTIGLNFRRGEYAYQRSQQEWRQAMRGVLALAATVVALTIGGLYAEYAAQSRRVALIDEQIRAVFKSTLPDAPVTREPFGDLEKEVAALQEQLNILNSIVPLSNYTSIDILHDISKAVPKSIRVDGEDFMMDADAIRFKGNTDTFESVDALKQNLLATGLFEDIVVRDVRADPKGGGVNFRLAMNFSRNFRPQTANE